MLYLTRERHPTTRPDVQALFGKFLPREGVDVHLVAIGDASVPWPAGRAHIFEARRRWQRPLAALRWLLALPRLVRKDIDIVVARDLFWIAAFARWLAMRQGKPFAYWMSLPFPLAWLELGRTQLRRINRPSEWLKGIRWWTYGVVSRWVLRRLVLSGATHAFAQSEEMARYLAGNGVAGRVITAVPMGVDLEELAAAPKAPVPASGVPGPWLAYLGALERARQPDWIVQAVALARRRVPSLKLLLVGDSQEPADRAWLTGVIQGLDMQTHVRRTGWLAPADALALVAGCDLALATCPRGTVYDMASPTKLAEYLALGLPVLATRQPDQDALLAAVGGGLTVEFSPDALAVGIERMLGDLPHWRHEASAAATRLGALRGYGALAALVAGRLRLAVQADGGPAGPQQD